MPASIRQFDLFEGIMPPDTPMGDYQLRQPALPPIPANPLDHHERFGVTAERHVRALEWLSDNNQAFANLEDRQAALEETGDAAGAAAVQEQLDRIVADHLEQPAPDVTRVPASVQSPPPRMKWSHLAQGRKVLVADLEKHLRGKGWPYVAVDDAKKAIFAGGNINAFDYLIYSSTGPNLLVLIVTRRPTPAQVQDMREWERIFGADFRTALVFQTGGAWRELSLEDLQTTDPLTHSRPLENGPEQKNEDSKL